MRRSSPEMDLSEALAPLVPAQFRIGARRLEGQVFASDKIGGESEEARPASRSGQ